MTSMSENQTTEHTIPRYPAWLRWHLTGQCVRCGQNWVSCKASVRYAEDPIWCDACGATQQDEHKIPKNLNWVQSAQTHEAWLVGEGCNVPPPYVPQPPYVHLKVSRP